MELSDNTLTILKNFSGINQNLMVREGNTVKTMSEARNIMASADVVETFPQTFGVYDLNEFISVLDLVDKPQLNFNESYVVVGDTAGRSKVKYFFSPEETLTTPSKDIKMPESEVKFELTTDTLTKLKRAASALGHSDVSITGKSGVLNFAVVDSANTTSNTYSIDVDGEFDSEKPFNFIMGISNLKIVPGDYDVSISSKLISHFQHKKLNVQYWIALEKSSTFGA